MNVICVSGGVATGKTTLAKKLAKSLDFEYVNVTEIIKERKLHDGFDSDTQSYIIDVEYLNKYLISMIKHAEAGLVIDSIYSHFLPRNYVDLVIVTTCDISELKKRLKKRKYSEEKIKENLQVEVFDTFIVEAKERRHNVLIVDTTKTYSLKKIVDYINAV